MTAAAAEVYRSVMHRMQDFNPIVKNLAQIVGCKTKEHCSRESMASVFLLVHYQPPQVKGYQEGIRLT